MWTEEVERRLEDQLIRDEGVRLKPYKDSVGKTTIGVGRNLDDVGISTEEAMFLLRSDIDRAAAWVRTSIPWSLNLGDARRAVLINMSFNMGAGLAGFAQFLGKLKAGDYEAAANEMLDSLWARQVGTRSERLAQQIRTGEWV